LIDLYEARNKPEIAEKWRAKLPQTEAKRDKRLGCGQKINIVFNARRQLVSDISRHLVTWMPQRKLFIGATERADTFLKLPAL
jgi:hypothetical protein